MEAALELTYDCNHECVMCHKRVEPDGPALERDEWLLLVEGLARAGFSSVRLTGGEPLMSPHLTAVAKAVAAAGMSVYVETNGTLVSDQSVHELAGVPGLTLQFSLYSLAASTHDAITQTAGSHCATIRGIERAQEAGIDVRVHAHLTRANFDDARDLAEWCDERDIPFTSSLTTFPRFDGGRGPLSRAVKNPTQIRDWIAANAEESTGDLPACVARVAVGPTGVAYPWVDTPLAVGNVRDGFDKVWVSDPSALLRQLRATERNELQRMSRCAMDACRRPLGFSASLRRDFRQVVGAACMQCPHQDALHRRGKTDENLTAERVEELAAEGRVDEVAAALANGHYVVVRAASDALSSIGDERVVNALRSVFDHEDAETRWAAEMALAPIRTPDAVKLMDDVFDKAGGRKRTIERAAVVESANSLCARGPAHLEWTRSSVVELVQVPAGRFTMGSPPCEHGRHHDESPHEVLITSPFLVGETPVTQAQWVEVMGPNDFYFAGHPDRPAERLDWHKAIIFCNRLSELEGLRPVYDGRRNEVLWDRSANGYRLLTEAEWEYVARAGTCTGYPSGDVEHASAGGKGCALRRTHGYLDRTADAELGAPPEQWHDDAAGAAEHPVATTPALPEAALDRIGWYRSNSGETTHLVGAKEPNAFGLYDTHGNVFEWVWDWYAPTSPPGLLRDPTGPHSGQGRVLRGGSWYNLAGHCRSAYRYDYTPDVRCFFVGLRIARDLRR